MRHITDECFSLMAKATQLAIYKRYKETSNTKGTTDTKVSVPVLFWNTVHLLPPIGLLPSMGPLNSFSPGLL